MTEQTTSYSTTPFTRLDLLALSESQTQQADTAVQTAPQRHDDQDHPLPQYDSFMRIIRR